MQCNTLRTNETIANNHFTHTRSSPMPQIHSQIPLQKNLHLMFSPLASLQDPLEALYHASHRSA